LFAARRATFCAAHPEYASGREHELAALPGDPRRPWARVFRSQLPRILRRCRFADHLRGNGHGPNPASDETDHGGSEALYSEAAVRTGDAAYTRLPDRADRSQSREHREPDDVAGGSI